jgi:hypothetical protein
MRVDGAGVFSKAEMLRVAPKSQLPETKRASYTFLGMHLTQPTPTNCIFSPQLDEFYHNMLWRLNEVHTHIHF